MRTLNSIFFGFAAIFISLASFAQSAPTPKLELNELRYQGWAGQVSFPELA